MIVKIINDKPNVKVLLDEEHLANGPINEINKNIGLFYKHQQLSPHPTLAPMLTDILEAIESGENSFSWTSDEIIKSREIHLIPEGMNVRILTR